ncbi:hypothetical protein ILUMI_11399 [Ignelater luminosus]|uniref:Serpin domain-containing protein n=1 Tax=Ignelater luminosus TaxID=2038154 RepID=A0A8K0CW17_IGNLU|nr:hypothetical protein ILUMI_11399 [Ignelater luminosus]
MKLLLLFAFGVLSTFAEDSQLLKEFSEGNIQFSADVYKEMLKSNSGNFLVCPLSVDIVLALVHAGARGETAQQLSTGLHLPESHEKIEQIFTKLAPTLQSNDKYNLSSANKVYVKDNFKISDKFKSTAVNVFDAEIQNIDFTKKEQAATEMNKWVEDKTHDKIKDLISPDDLNQYTRAVLINAIYFHGQWVKQFDEYSTRKRTFYLNANDHVETDMMEITDSFNYYESPDLNAKFLELPYEGGDITMTFVLPNDKDGLPALEARIDEVLATPKYSFERVHVIIPKFKIETTIQFKPILQALGIKDAFEDNADFSGIGAQKEPLKISKVIQKAFIEVEEKGTTAAAATAVMLVELASFDIPTSPPKQFVADHPFVCYLRSSSAIIFIGRYSGLSN